MVSQDLHELNKFLPSLPDMSVLLLSPSVEQYNAFDAHFYDVAVATKDVWDINEPSELKTDLIYLSMVMHYIQDPDLAIKNLSASCKYILIQDLIRRDRSADRSEFGDDGDCMRYGYGAEQPVVQGYDLTGLNPIYFKAYNDGDSRHFIMMIKT